jgi:hypothetical protein
MPDRALTPGRAEAPPVGRTNAAPDPLLAGPAAALPDTLLVEPTFMFPTPPLQISRRTLPCLVCRMVNAGQILPLPAPGRNLSF